MVNAISRNIRIKDLKFFLNCLLNNMISIKTLIRIIFQIIKEKFFKSGFHRLAGSKKLENQIKDGISAIKIKLSWKKDLETYKIMREKYILYN